MPFTNKTFAFKKDGKSRKDKNSKDAKKYLFDKSVFLDYLLDFRGIDRIEYESGAHRLVVWVANQTNPFTKTAIPVNYELGEDFDPIYNLQEWQEIAAQRGGELKGFKMDSPPSISFRAFDIPNELYQPYPAKILSQYIKLDPVIGAKLSIIRNTIEEYKYYEYDITLRFENEVNECNFKAIKSYFRAKYISGNYYFYSFKIVSVDRYLIKVKAVASFQD